MAVASFFGVSERAVFRWKAKGAPLEEPAKLLAWIKKQDKLSRTPSVAGRLRDPHVLKALTAAMLGRNVSAKQPKAETPTDEQPARDTGGDAPDLETGRLNKINLEAQRLRMAIEREKGEVISRAQIREQVQKVVSVFSAELGAMLGDLPGQLAGMDEVTILERLTARIGEAFETLQAKLEELGK